MHWWSRPQSARGIPAPAHCVWIWAAPGWAALPLPALNCLLWQNAITCTGGQAGLDPDRLIFIDESGLSTKMARLRDWAPQGERCRAAIPLGHWKAITFTGGLTFSGFVAPMLLDGPMDGECFRAWVDRGQGRHTPLPAAPGLRRGRLYSPDCNPIETAFAKLKAHVRKAAARNFNAPEQAAAHALTKFDPNQCTNFLVHAGYGLD